MAPVSNDELTMTSRVKGPPGWPPLSARTAAWLLRCFCVITIAAGAGLLLATGYVLIREESWLAHPSAHEGETVHARNERAFFHGTIGTELAPLPVLMILPEVCDKGDGSVSHFYPFGKDAGSWIEQFGFLPASLAPESVKVDGLAKTLPLGFTISHYRPRSGAPSPVAFVGLACATCHTTVINGKLVAGTGNSSLNLFAWIDAFQAALRDRRVTYDAIMIAYESHAEYPPLSLEEKAMIRLWLTGARAKQTEDAARYDEPFGNGLSMHAEHVPTGPSRTQPFRTLVRTLLKRPGTDMKVYTKIAAIYLEEQDEWGQFDGGIHGLYRRSAAAALAAGATPQNMSLPEIADNIKWASDFIATHRGPTWNQIFPDKPVDSRSQEVSDGQAVYLAHCNRCHGHPQEEHWVPGELQGKLVPLDRIKTDPERVSFRYYDELPDVLSAYFPKNHPFDFPRGELRPTHRQNATEPVERAFINKRMHSMFSRAPFLHNGSVLTLAELINLENRRSVFFRGRNEYDDGRVGLKSPVESEHDPRDGRLYFRFDTSAPGNSNAGHDYPWRRDEVETDRSKQTALKALLEYLKTI